MASVITTTISIFKWIFFVFFVIGFTRWFYPVVVFIQICPIFLFLRMSIPASISAVLEGFLEFQVQSVTPLGDFSAWMDIYFPSLTLHYYQITGYVLFSKLFDIVFILLVIIITKFDEGIVRMFPKGIVRTYMRQSLVRKGYAVRSLSIMALLPSFAFISGAFIASRDFASRMELFNFVCSLLMFGFSIIYVFNHSATLR